MQKKGFRLFPGENADSLRAEGYWCPVPLKVSTPLNYPLLMPTAKKPLPCQASKLCLVLKNEWTAHFFRESNQNERQNHSQQIEELLRGSSTEKRQKPHSIWEGRGDLIFYTASHNLLFSFLVQKTFFLELLHLEISGISYLLASVICCTLSLLNISCMMVGTSSCSFFFYHSCLAQ
jgi:hypothetical protein